MFFFFGTLKCNEMQMAVVRSTINEFRSFFAMDQFMMMSPFHIPFHLGADCIIDGARAMLTLWRRLNWTFHFYR